MTDLERLAEELDVLAKQYTRRYKRVACDGNMLLAGYLEGRSAGLTQATVLLRGEVERLAEIDKEVSG